MKFDKNLLKYDIILQNCGSKQVFLFQRQPDVSERISFISFNIDLSDLPKGEYNYAIIINMREDDVFYDIKADLKRTIVKTNEGDVELSLLNPMMGLLRIEAEKNQALCYNETKKSMGFEDNNKTYFYKE